MSNGRVVSLFAVSLSVVVPAGMTGQQSVRAPLTRPDAREVAPGFALDDASGRPVRLSDFRGRPLIVNLWATTCGGCKAELPIFVKLSDKYKETTVVGVSMDVMYNDLKTSNDGWALVKPFVASHGIRYPIVLDDGSVEKAFSVTALPATYLIDRQGRLAAKYIGVVDEGDLESNLRLLLAER
jgi:thiol-disulfide isomerase/thioredoxin